MFFRKSQPANYETEIVLSDRTLPLHISANTRATRLTLRIATGGKAVRVTTPPATPRAEVERFIERYKGWIEVRIAKLPAPSSGQMLKAGAQIPILGVAHLIVHVAARGLTEIKTFDDGQQPQLIVYGDSQHLPRRICDFLKKQAENTIAPLVANYANEVGRKPIILRYKDTKSRWGSCSYDGQLSFSWRIIMAPQGVVEYLVAHEVSHLIEMNHGPKFWALCAKLCPKYKQYQAWLKRNGQALHAIDFH